MSDYVGVIPAAGLASRLGPLGYPKELLPITYVPGEGGHLRPLPVIEASFRQLREAGVSRSLVITSDRKPELMQYLGNGGGIGLDLAFLQQARAEGLAARCLKAPRPTWCWACYPPTSPGNWDLCASMAGCA